MGRTITLIALVCTLGLSACGTDEAVGDPSDTAARLPDQPALALPDPPPAAPGTAPAWLEADGRFAIFSALLHATGTTVDNPSTGERYTWWEIWQADSAGDRRFTVFVPTDEAFRSLPKETLDALLSPDLPNRERALLLGYHVVMGDFAAADLTARELQVWDGPNDDGRVAVGVDPLTWGGFPVVETDHVADRYRFHVLDGVVIPDQVRAYLAG